MITADRATAAYLGLAIGDAYAAGLEFQDRDWIRRHVDFSHFINLREHIQVLPEKLAAFKLFYWQRSVLNINKYQNKKFDWDVVSNKQLEIAKDIYTLYLKVPSTEIWTIDTIQTTVKQIEYYFESGAFKEKDDAISVLNELKIMAQSINEYAELETKNTRSNQKIPPFNLYNSDLVIGTNCIHVNIDGGIYSYISFNTLNSLTTANQQFCEEIEHWMKNLIKKSTLISGVAEKQRFQFFNKIYKGIDLAIEKIKNY